MNKNANILNNGNKETDNSEVSVEVSDLAVENKGKNKDKNKGLENLRMWKKGQSGNPKGRPFGQRDYATIYKEALIKLAEREGTDPLSLEEEILIGALTSAKKKDYRFYKDVIDRLHGTPTNKSVVDVTTNGENINNSEIVWVIKDYRKPDSDNQKDVCS